MKNRKCSFTIGLFTYLLYAQPLRVLAQTTSRETALEQLFDENRILFSTLSFVALVIVVFILTQAVYSNYLKRQKNLLQKALDDLESEQNVRASFMDMLTHDIRTPFTVTMGYADMALRYIDDPHKVAEYLMKVRTANDELLELLNDVLTIAQLDSNKLQLTDAPCDLFLCGQDLLPKLRIQAEKKGIEFVFHFGNIRDRYVYVDYIHVNQILENIVTNAIKYSPAGGTVDFFLYQTLEAKDNQATYAFVIQDTGVGMTKEQIDRAYEPFYRGDTETVRNVPGSGLGLVIVKRLLDLMNGSIALESEVGKGTKVTIHVPMRLQEDQHPSNDVRFLVSTDISKLQGQRILIAEDNELNMEITTDILHDAGFEVEQAENGEIAVNMIREKGPHYYDCVLMDIEMPILDGHGAVRQIRELPGMGKLPIIMLSAFAYEEDKRKSIEAGANDHLTKPVVVAELMESLGRFMEYRMEEGKNV